MRRRLWVSVALTVVLVMSALLLAACDPQVTLGDIFVSYTSEGEITRAELQFTLPVGWTVLTDSAANYSSLHADSDIGYVKSLGAYIVTDGDGNLNLVRPDGEGGAVFMLHGSDGGTAFGAEAIVVKGDLVLMRINNGSASVVDLSTGREVLTQSETKGITVSKETGIEDAVRILDDELIAVAPAYSSAVAEGQTAYTPVYRVSTGGLAACDPQVTLGDILPLPHTRLGRRASQGGRQHGVRSARLPRRLLHREPLSRRRQDICPRGVDGVLFERIQLQLRRRVL